MISSTLANIAVDLMAYGEEHAASVVVRLSPEEHERLGKIAADLLYSPNGPRLLSRCLAMAAVQLLEGELRPLKRNRRLMHFYAEGKAHDA